MKSTLALLPLLALSALTHSVQTAQAEQAADPAARQESESLKKQLDATRLELATERERGHMLQLRLQCRETMLQGYDACQENHDSGSEAYWDCVQSVLAETADCPATEQTVTGPGSDATVR